MNLKKIFLTVMLISFSYGICSAQEYQGTVSSPVFNGGLRALKEFIQQNIKYPQNAGKGKTAAAVTLSYTINQQGQVEDIKILRGINAQCDSEAVRVAKLIGGWKPAVQFGKVLSVKAVMPVEFYLDEEKQKGGTFPVKGIVSSKATGDPIEGALVLVKGTNEGAITDQNGYYSISASGEELEIEFSSLGYGIKTEKIGKNRIINEELLPEDFIIDFSSK